MLYNLDKNMGIFDAEAILVKRAKLFIVFLLSLTLFGCSLWTNVTTNTTQDMAGVDNVTTMEVAKTGSAAGQGLLIGEKVITTINLSYETLEYEASIDYLNQVVEKYGAYIEYSYEYSGDNGIYNPAATSTNYRQGSYTIRIPNASVNQFMQDLEGDLGTKISEQIGNQDVTQSYKDTETRISVLQRKEERLLALLDQAETVDQILAIEDSLSATISEREVLQSELDNMDSLIDYTALYLTVTERSRISTNRGGSVPFWGRVKEAFLDSVYAFYYWIQDAAIGLIYALPYIVVTLGFILLFWLIKKMFFKTRWGKKRIERQLQEKKMIEDRRKERFVRTHPKKTDARNTANKPAEKPTEPLKEEMRQDTLTGSEVKTESPAEQPTEEDKTEK